MSTAWSIRLALPEDLSRVVEIENAVFSAPWSASAIAAELAMDPGRLSLAAECDTRLVGYAFLWRVLDELHLVSLAVDPDYRRRGIADGLLHALLHHEFARHARLMTLEVRAGNAAALALYRRHGFIEVAVRSEYYPDNREDAVVMLKTLRGGPSDPAPRRDRRARSA